MFLDLPEIKITKKEVTDTEIKVRWKFGTDGRRRKLATEDDGYSVGVQIQYKKNSDKEFQIYPEDGSKLPAEQVDH